MPDIYMDSEAIGQKIKYSEELNLVVVNEKNGEGRNIVYTMDELAILESEVGQVTKGIHAVKKVFSGTVVKWKGEA